MDDLGHIIDNAVVPAVEHSIQLYDLGVDVLDALDEVFHVLVELLLELLGAQGLMDVRLHVERLTIVVLDRVVSLISHGRAVVVLVARGVPVASCTVLLAILANTDLVLLAFKLAIIGSATRWLQEHVVDVGH